MSSLPPPPAMIFYGRTLRGLEELACEELSGRFGARIHASGHREIFFSGVEADQLATAGLLDDVFVLCGQIDGIDHTRAALDKLRSGAAELLESVRRALAMRSAKPASLQVVASFLGRRNYNRYEIEAAVGTSLAEGLGLPFVTGLEKDSGAVLRAHLRDSTALLALRWFAKPLRQRSYKIAHHLAATPPQVARALAMLAGLSAGSRVLDPYCGTGTVLIEAGLLQPAAKLHGGDISVASLRGGKVNASAAGVEIAWCKMSALALGFEDRAFDRIIANIPWGRQVSHAGEEETAWTELNRVLRPRGKAVVLAHQAGRSYPGFVREAESPLRLYGQSSWIVTLRPA